MRKHTNQKITNKKQIDLYRKDVIVLMNAKVVSILLLSVFVIQDVFAQLKDCNSKFVKDTLIIENNLIRRRWLWNNGALIHIDILNKRTNQLITGDSLSKIQDLRIPGENGRPQNATVKTYIVAETASSYAFLATEVITLQGELECKKIFRIYADCPAIACDIFLRGRSFGWKEVYKNEIDLKKAEETKTTNEINNSILIADKIAISGQHWKMKTIEFFDVTDQNNNLVQAYERLLYRQEYNMRGNILLAQNIQNKKGFFLLKESPVSKMQLHYQGFDFIIRFGQIKSAGIGIGPLDILDSEWVKGYSIILGVGDGNSEQSLLSGLRQYQKLQRKIIPSRDEMIISNTWGDRSSDSRVNETFILKEIEAAAKLGITHVQIDDGWQFGRSANSIIGKGSLEAIWKTPDYWKPDAKKFPEGFQKIILAAKAKNINISLWFNPSSDNSYANWEKDADVLIDLYKQFGISMWKIDGVLINNKIAEINFRKLLDKVTEATNYQAVFNLDVTAGKRFGYFSFAQYGNVFLENRYTDWVNYFPYTTLRNLWQLSKYTPPQRFQIEFLNKWRNISKYALNDSLAPSNYNFDYLFAITMVAEPLAWFEVSSLPAKAFELSSLIKKYKEVRTSLHQGEIFPIGNEPDGFSWTGFQSINNKGGYFLIFRENNSESTQFLTTWLPSGTVIKIDPIIGNGESYLTKVDTSQKIMFNVDKRNSFVLLRYSILNKKT